MCIRDRSPFPQFQTTERPDKCSAEILNGRVVVLTDHSPMALILPAVFNDFLQVSEEMCIRDRVKAGIHGDEGSGLSR